MVQAHRLLNVDRGDIPKLRILAPTFGICAASTVVLASLSKALFLAQNPISLLPWMFLGAAGMTAVSSLIYVAIIGRVALSRRFPALLALAVVSLFGLRLAFSLAPTPLSIVILLWCPTIGHLVIVQVWNAASTLLPTRQGKRLFPILAAVTTLGAALGGGMVQLVLEWVAAADLLVVAAALLSWPLFRVQGMVRRLESDVRDDLSSTDASMDASIEEPASERGVTLARTVSDIAKSPLLAEVALLVFLLQSASLVIDYQFSAELKPMFDAEGIARFLGTFYWMSNLVVLVVTLALTGRVLRFVGIGLALAMSAIVVGAGSATYVAAAVGGRLPTFWVIAATAFIERIAEYALSRPAMQMVYMPLQTRGGERAKTIIDGVVHRGATAVVSVMLLVAAPDLASQFRLSPPAIIACVVAVYLGMRIGPNYRQALFDALRTRRLDARITGYLRDGLGKGALRAIEQRLSGSPAEIRRALVVARELSLPVPQASLARLVLHDDERVARAALLAMERLGRTPSRELLAQMLDANRPPAVLRVVLRLFAERGSAELADAVRHLTQHPDPGVASAACVLRIRAAGTLAMESFDEEVAVGSDRVARRRSLHSDAERFTGITRAGAFARELPELLGTEDLRVRAEAIEQMGQLALPYFIDPLIACLTQPGVRNDAIDALVRYGDRVLPSIQQGLADAQLSLACRVAMLKVVERIGTSSAVALLVHECRYGDRVIADRAVETLWRIGANDGAAVPEEPLVMPLIDLEMKRLERYAVIESLLVARPTPRRLLFLDELHAQLMRCERRVFRLLGLIVDRDAMQRAYLHYRSTERRARSNAIELLEQHVGKRLRKLVPLVERAEGADGKLRPQSMVIRGMGAKARVDELLTEDDPWLGRVWAWLGERGDAAISWEDPLDRVLSLRDMATFEGMAAEQLLPIAAALERQDLADGDEVFAPGDDGRALYWVLDGKVALVLSDQPLFRLTKGECFGEMEALDGSTRIAAARASGDATVGALAADDFQDALEVEPQLLRNLIGVLSARLRSAS